MKGVLLYLVCSGFVICALSVQGVAQCSTGGGPDTRPGLGGNTSNFHPFANQCLAASGTNVTITIEAMADLGCNAFDGTHDPPQGGQCPTNCSPICCDTAPTSKYVTVTANGSSLNPFVSGSTNMPTNGQFFKEWNTDCGTSSQACLEAGRSPCDPNSPSANKRIVTVPAATWNAWLGSSGNTVTIRVSASSAVTSAPTQTQSLALYCQNLGFNLCPFQGCTGLCGPDTFSRVSISYAGVPPCVPSQCPQGTQCQLGDCDAAGQCILGNQPAGTLCGSSGSTACTNPDTCNGFGSCQNNHDPNGTPCDDGIFCNGGDACSNGSCSTHNGDPCPGEVCDETTNVCVPVIVSSDAPSGAIDARQPSDQDDTNATGWDTITLTMSSDASGLTANDFTITSTGGITPFVQFVTTSGTQATLDFDTFIPPGEWTQITYDPSSSVVCLGYLPADVNNDSTSASPDILWLIDCLNGVQTCEIWQCDVDRSVLCGAPDILMVIDLLNGAGMFTAWNNQSLPPNPCDSGGGTGGGSGGGLSNGFDPGAGAQAAQANANTAFADGFVSYLTQTTIDARSNEAEVTTIVRALTGWCVGHFTADERRALADQISNASLTFADARMQAFAPDILAALRP